MCGRFSQPMTREDYLALLPEEAEHDIPYDPEPIGRFNVAPGTKVLLLSERDEQLHLDPVFRGYAPGWWNNPPLINTRFETEATSRMFKRFWHFRQLSSSLKVIIYSCQQLNTLSQNSNVVGIGVLNTLH